MHFLEHYLVAAGLFVLIDSLWLKFVANTIYKQALQGLLRDKPNVPAAAVFYLIYMLGVIVFAVNPALAKDSVGDVAWRGALLGLVMYATYDLTNLSTLKNWPAKLSIIDMGWGTFVTCLVSVLTVVIF